MIFIDSASVAEEMRKIAEKPVGAFTNPRTPLCITVDMSFSMESRIGEIKYILRIISENLATINKRDFTLIVMGIYNSNYGPLYIGELHGFDCESFIRSLPDHGSGTTPLVACYSESQKYLDMVRDACMQSRQICTIPVFLSVTDFLSTEDPSCYRSILKNLLDDVRNNRKIIVEFVTMDNPNGLDFGGYNVQIDGPYGRRNIENCIKALRLASSTAIDASGGMLGSVRIPRKDNKPEYEKYLSEVMVGNMMMFYSNISNGIR